MGRPIRIRATDLVTVSGAFYVDFPNGPSTVVIEYETEIPVSNMSALTAQADELMKFFQADIESTGLGSVVLRASHFEGSGALREGDGYGFLYEKRSDGSWVRTEERRKSPW